MPCTAAARTTRFWLYLFRARGTCAQSQVSALSPKAGGRALTALGKDAPLVSKRAAGPLVSP